MNFKIMKRKNKMEVWIKGVFAFQEDESMGLVLGWADEKGYFGEIKIEQDHGYFSIDTENEEKDFVKKVLNALVDKAEIKY